MKILFSGGGTLGSVMPLIAIAEAVHDANRAASFYWIGTSHGPEERLVVDKGIRFTAIPSGKLRRYWSFANVIDFFKIFLGFFAAYRMLRRERPQVVVSAGGYVSVPVHWAAFWLGIPAWVHQQDVNVGLANRLMFGSAQKVTAALEDTARLLGRYRAEWIGNPCRSLATSLTDAQIREQYNLQPASTVILVVGGGTGSLSLNTLVKTAVPQLPSTFDIIHLLGEGKSIDEAQKQAAVYKNYHPFEFATSEMANLYAVATVVVARAGMGTLTELSMLKKPALIVPKTETHQEQNSQYVFERGGVVILNEDVDTGTKLAESIMRLVSNPEFGNTLAIKLAKALPVARPEKIVEIVNQLI